MSGIIYKSTNQKTGKCYIGLTTQSLQKRKREHISSAMRGGNMYFQRTLSKYGPDSFHWEIIDSCNDDDNLKELEKFYIEYYNTKAPHGYNLTSGGDGRLNPSECVREHLRRITKGENNPMYGKKHSKNTRRKIAEKAMGRVHSLAQRKKSSDSRCKKGLFGFTGVRYTNKHIKPWYKVWSSQIMWNTYSTYLGHFNDPVSGEIIYNIVKNEIYQVSK